MVNKTFAKKRGGCYVPSIGVALGVGEGKSGLEPASFVNRKGLVKLVHNFISWNVIVQCLTTVT